MSIHVLRSYLEIFARLNQVYQLDNSGDTAAIINAGGMLGCFIGTWVDYDKFAHFLAEERMDSWQCVFDYLKEWFGATVIRGDLSFMHLEPWP